MLFSLSRLSSKIVPIVLPGLLSSTSRLLQEVHRPTPAPLNPAYSGPAGMIQILFIFLQDPVPIP
jgi:hypothetical protein